MTSLKFQDAPIEIGRVTIRYRGPLLWNNIPLELRKVDNLEMLKNFN